MREKEGGNVIVHIRRRFRQFKICHLFSYFYHIPPYAVCKAAHFCAKKRTVSNKCYLIRIYFRKQADCYRFFKINVTSKSSGYDNPLKIMDGKADFFKERHAAAVYGALCPYKVVYVGFAQYHIPVDLCLICPCKHIFENTVCFTDTRSINIPVKFPKVIYNPGLKQGCNHYNKTRTAYSLWPDISDCYIHGLVRDSIY